MRRTKTGTIHPGQTINTDEFCCQPNSYVRANKLPPELSMMILRWDDFAAPETSKGWYAAEQGWYHSVLKSHADKPMEYSVTIEWSESGGE